MRFWKTVKTVLLVALSVEWGMVVGISSIYAYLGLGLFDGVLILVAYMAVFGID